MSSNDLNMAQTHVRLLRFFASKNPFFSLLKVVPLLIVYIAVLLLYFQKIGWISLSFAAGIITWSLFEYVVHRWVYHVRIANKKVRWLIDAFHAHHHHNLTDYRVLNAGFFIVYPVSAFLLGIVFLITRDFSYTAAFGIGMTCYYVFYEFVHYYIHFKEWTTGYMQFVQKFHLFHHHHNWYQNFGNTIALWDRIFGTYNPEYKRYTLDEEDRKELIVNNR